MISPAVAGYLRIPPVWIGDRPTDEELLRAPLTDLIRDQHRRTLCGGIHVRVRRDGVFLFDFSDWPRAEPTEIPGHTREPGQTIPREVTDAEMLAERKLVLRTQIMNAHQACLSTAEIAVHQRSSQLGELIHPYHTIRPLTLEDQKVGVLDPNDPTDSFIALQMKFVESRQVKRLKNRPLIEQDTLEFSFQVLEQILDNEFEDLVQLVELLYRAAGEYPEYRFAESLILSWAVCEKLLDKLWKTYIAENERDDEGGLRINKKRRDRLTGSDFTASVISEILELNGRLPFPLFQNLEILRQSRNGWLHSLKAVSDSDAAKAVRTTEHFMEHVTGIRMHLSLFRFAGDRQIPKHLMP